MAGAQRYIGIDPAQRYYCVAEIEFRPLSGDELVAVELQRLAEARQSIEAEYVATVAAADKAKREGGDVPATAPRRRRVLLNERLPLTYGRLRVLSWRLYDLSPPMAMGPRLCVSFDQAASPAGGGGGPRSPALWHVDEQTVYMKSRDLSAAQTTAEDTVGRVLADWPSLNGVQCGQTPVFIEQPAGTYVAVPSLWRLMSTTRGIIQTLDHVRGVLGAPRSITISAKKFGLARGPTDAAAAGGEDAVAAAEEEEGPPKKKRRRQSKKEAVATTYEERKDTCSDIVRERLVRDGDVYAVALFDRIDRLLEGNSKLHLKTADMADAVAVALAKAEEAAAYAWRLKRADYGMDNTS
jgi:hypothetical protein